MARPKYRASGWSVLAMLIGLGPAAGWACSPLDPERRQEDRPISVAPDGSFVDAAEEDVWIGVTGRPVRDIGGSKVGQVLEVSEDCLVYQILLFVDCATADAILVRGLRHPEGGAWWTERSGPFGWPIMQSTQALQAPDGPLALTPNTTVADILALAAQEDMDVFDDVVEFVSDIAPHNRFDPFLGCRMFYPSSRGAN